MLITRVEMDDIKCYESGSFDFRSGVTAICGPNGSGKTTIVEAISWALFDYLPYKKEDFVRKGAKKGSVRVSFISSVDGREYTIYRDTAASYYIYDPITKLRLAEQKNQVLAWIRQHLGVESTADLRTLFTSAVGVPQGGFTADFLDQPYRRKAEFDRVLRVDEFQRSSDELLSLVRFIEQRLSISREEAARAEVETSNLETLERDYEKSCAAIVELEKRVPSVEQEKENFKSELSRLEAIALEIDRKSTELRLLQAKLIEFSRLSESLLIEVEKSRVAKKVMMAAKSGHEDFLRANESLAQFEEKRRKAEEISREVIKSERELALTAAEIEHLREKSASIKVDRERLSSLQPAIQEQDRLERQRAEIQRTIGELAELEQSKLSGESIIDSLRSEYRKITTSIKDAESFREAAERSARMIEERNAAEEEVRLIQSDLSRLTERKSEYERLETETAKLRLEEKTLNARLQELNALESLATSIPSLESSEREALAEIANIEARLRHDNYTLSQIKEGLCPLLSQRCLNMKDGEGLDQYFRVQIGSDQDRLNVLNAERDSIGARLSGAREAYSRWLTASSVKDRQAALHGELDDAASRLQTLTLELSGLVEKQQGLKDALDRLSALDSRLKETQEASARYQQAAALKERRDYVESEGRRQRKLVEDLTSRISVSKEAADKLPGVEARLLELGDPKGQSRALHESLSREGEVTQNLTRKAAEENSLKGRLAELRESLAPFSGLDDDIRKTQAKRQASEKDSRVFVENRPIAELLDDRERQLREAERTIFEDKERVGQLGGEIDNLRASYSPDRHADVREAFDEASARFTALTFELAHVKQRAIETRERIDTLAQVRQRLQELVAEKSRLEEVMTMSEVVRDILRKAGPYITEAHLRSISIESNQMYRDITGNQMVTLRWDSGYEIILEENGHERSLSSLSGGEQMIAALSVRLALLKELSQVRVAFFDEPTTNVDEQRRRNLAEQIGKIKDFDQLFVISHDDAFEGFTDQVISLGGTN